jgi:hypothetical protein
MFSFIKLGLWSVMLGGLIVGSAAWAATPVPPPALPPGFVAAPSPIPPLPSGMPQAAIAPGAGGVPAVSSTPEQPVSAATVEVPVKQAVTLPVLTLDDVADKLTVTRDEIWTRRDQLNFLEMTKKYQDHIEALNRVQ